MLELGTGGWPGASHVDLHSLLGSSDRAKEYLERLGDAGLTISALSCHANPVHPQPEIGRRGDVTFRRIVQLAECLKVPVVITSSVCPGRQDAELDRSCVATGVAESFKWLWEERLMPHCMEDAGLWRFDKAIDSILYKGESLGA